MRDFHKDSEESSRLNKFLFVSICGVLVLSTIAFGAVDMWALGTLSVVMAVLVVVWGAETCFGQDIVLSINPLQLPILGLIFIGLIQLLPFGTVSTGAFEPAPVNSISIAPYSTRMAIVQLCVYFVFLALAFAVITGSKRIRKLVYLMIVFGALMGFFAILQRLAASDDMIYGLRQAYQANPFGSYVNQHHFAALMEMMIALPLALLFGKATKKDKRALLIIASIIMGLAILFTGSRAGFISLLSVVCFIVIANMLGKKSESKSDSKENWRDNFRRNVGLSVAGVALIFVIVGIVIYLTDDSTVSRVISMQSGEQELSSGRTHFWSTALLIFKDYPIIGSGLDSFGIAFPFYDTWNGEFRLEYAHNDYLQILSDAGIVGFLCVVAFIYFLFKQSLRVIIRAKSRFLRNTAIGALAGCFGILIHSFFDFPLRTPSNTYFFLVFAVIATTSVSVDVIESHRRPKMALKE